MAVVTSDLLTAILTNNRALFQAAFKAAQALQGWLSFTSTINSTGKIEQYNWLGTTPVMQDVTNSQLVLDSLHSFNFTIENLLYKAGIEVQREMIEDDKLSLLPPRISQLGQEAARHPGSLVLDLFESPGNAFDGTAFFADTRTIGDSANVDNQIDVDVGTPTAPTVAEMQTVITQARKTMRGFQDDKGRERNSVPDTIVYPPALEHVVYQALNGSSTPGSVGPMPTPSQSGIIAASGYTMYCNPQLTSDVALYFLSTGGVVNPFIFQSRVAPTMEGVTNPNTESGVIRDRFIHSVRARYNVGVGDPRDALKVTLI